LGKAGRIGLKWERGEVYTGRYWGVKEEEQEMGMHEK